MNMLTISWYRVGNGTRKIINTDDKYIVTNYRRKLIIKNLDESDTGQYQCEGLLGSGYPPATSSANLFVQGEICSLLYYYLAFKRYFFNSLFVLNIVHSVSIVFCLLETFWESQHDIVIKSTSVLQDSISQLNAYCYAKFLLINIVWGFVKF